MSETLKTCPFCGGEAYFHEIHPTRGDDSVIETVQVLCRECKSEIPPIAVNWSLKPPYAAERLKAASLWNTRTDRDRNRWRSVAERMDAFMQHDDDCMVVNGSVGDQCTCGLSDVESAFDSLRKEATGE